MVKIDETYGSIGATLLRLTLGMMWNSACTGEVVCLYHPRICRLA